ncbi:MAG: CopG family transcriptional regulator [Anaerolineae bacterium]
MATKIRKQIYIEPDQEARLKQLAGALGLTEAEIIRQAIDRQTRQFRPARRNLKAWEAERAFIMQLIQQGPVPERRTWRREDLHER